MTVGRLRAVVCTSSLDLGVDWGDVDLVINVGAPKGASRLLQRIGRANHRMDEPSRGVLIPANRFEVLECTAAIDAIAAKAQDTPPLRTGALDVLAQHVLGRACGEPFLADELYAEATSAAPYAGLTRADFDAVLDFVATGGYALKAYERFAKIRQGKDGRWRVAHPMVAQRYRMNVGTIVEADMLKVRLVRSRASQDDPARRAGARRGRGIFHRDADARRHLRVRRRGAALRGDRRGRGLCLARRVRRPESAVLRRRQVSALDLSRRSRAPDRGRRQALGRTAAAGARVARHPALALAPAGPTRSPGRDVSARRQILSRLLSVRRAAGASDARHAADAAARARAAAPDGFRRQRIRAGDLGPRRRGAAHLDAANCRSRNCSTRTCWATTSKPGSRSRR